MISLLRPSELFPFCPLTATPPTVTLTRPFSLIVLYTSCFRPKPSSSPSTLHAEILGEGRDPGRQWRRACRRAWGYGGWRWGQYWRQVSSSGDNLLLAVPRHVWSFTGHRLFHRLHGVLQQKKQDDYWLYFWSDLRLWGIAITTFMYFALIMRSSVYIKSYTLPRLSVLKAKPSRFERLLASATRPQNWVFMPWCVRFFGQMCLSYRWKKCPKYILSCLFHFLDTYIHIYVLLVLQKIKLQFNFLSILLFKTE